VTGRGGQYPPCRLVPPCARTNGSARLPDYLVHELHAVVGGVERALLGQHVDEPRRAVVSEERVERSLCAGGALLVADGAADAALGLRAFRTGHAERQSVA
jgi:hypothetical protein